MVGDAKAFSAADVAKIRADRPILRTGITQELPKIGSIILYNEVDNYASDINGRKPIGARGIGCVVHYSTHIMDVQLLSVPGIKIYRGFRIADVRVGTLRYQCLREPVYMGCKGLPGAYTSEDLCLESPHPDIRRLFIDK